MPIREGFRRRIQGHAKGVAGGDTALFHGGGGEAWKADDVACRIDMWNGGLEGDGINLDLAAGIRFDADGFEAKAAHIAAAPGGIEQDIRTHQAAIGEGYLHAIGFHRNFLHGAAQADGHAPVAHLMDEIINQLAVNKFKNGFAGLDQCDRNIKG